MSSLSFFDGRVIFDHLPTNVGQVVNRWLRNELGLSCVASNLIGEHRSLIDRYGGRYSVTLGHFHFNRAELAAGHVVEVQLKVAAPATAGRYRLTVTPVQDGVCWFDERGFSPAVLVVNVVSATAALGYFFDHKF